MIYYYNLIKFPSVRSFLCFQLLKILSKFLKGKEDSLIIVQRRDEDGDSNLSPGKFFSAHVGNACRTEVTGTTNTLIVFAFAFASVPMYRPINHLFLQMLKAASRDRFGLMLMVAGVLV